MTDSKICLNMIVKNESRIIRRCLDSVLSIIDYVVITDTGSTDQTIKMIEEYLKEKNIQGKVYQHTWKNFGYNRTNSILNAKEFLNSIHEDLSKVFLFFMDADMKIVITPDFQKSQLTPLHSVQIIQKNAHMKYYNTRFCRSDIGITCRGVTHEYYDVPRPFSNSKLDTIYIDDIGDGGAKADKFERDIRLLEEGIKEEPNSDRYHFYLAQSYHCIGQYEKSIELYKKRIALGGWREEIYHSHLTIANMYKDALKDWDKALEHYMLSFQSSGGVRMEGLMKVVEYYKDKREYHTAMIFLDKMLKIPYPKDDVLFIDYQVYSYKPIYEFSIISYYVNLKYEGLIANQYLLLDRSAEFPHHLKDCTRRNLVFYIRKLPSSIQPLQNIQLQEHYKSSSASFTTSPSDSNVMEGVLRMVNYHIDQKGHYHYPPNMDYIHTENDWVTIQDGKITSQTRIKIAKDCKTDFSRVYYQIQGLEDARHFIFKDEIYMSCTSFEYGRDAKASMVLCHLNKDTKEVDRIVSLKYEEHKIQKNWVPFLYQDKFCFVYSYEPFILLEVNPETGECSEIMRKSNTKYDLSELRGSAPPIWLPDHKQYLIMTHEVVFCETRKYIERFTLWDEDFNLLKISEPFYFNHLFIEFSLSVMYNPENQILTIPFSHMDNSTHIATLPFKEIPWLPQNMRNFFHYFKDLDSL